MQQTNATWSQVVVTNLEAILAKNLSNNFQVVATFDAAVAASGRDWNPTDPARFIQPDAFPNNRDLSRHLFGNGDDNSLDGGGAESGVAYRPVLGAAGGPVLCAVGRPDRGELRDPGRRISRPRRGAERDR